MLRNIPKNISPELMLILMQMGHGDEIVFGDANFPAQSLGKRVVRLDGERISSLLQSIMPLFPLDNFCGENVFLMEIVAGKGEAPAVWEKYEAIIRENDRETAFIKFKRLERFAFYERAKNAFAVVATGEKEKYSNIILKMGIVE